MSWAFQHNARVNEEKVKWTAVILCGGETWHYYHNSTNQIDLPLAMPWLAGLARAFYR
jgi:hypothetical protein